ncbi:VOC family protein [Algoriphagus hitonicola]|uniref:Catechol 2,3-dioxygenase n=1 Tax=Algoriphagus hitonicola TaxID=435880 RepID=A0A1I2RA54_9BACT|nr:VOC family protein [Algoriphagus hitonicola]SFG37342.1 Catechol 2,3-dioxygenase [Algoriphagus hitonicola]
MTYTINGIQQIGIGVKDAENSWSWYKKAFGMDVPIFKDRAEATLMTAYTGNSIQQRYAILAMNLQGGGGFEVWQYTSRVPQPAAFQIQMNDLGILGIKIRCKNILQTKSHLEQLGATILSEPSISPSGALHFYVQDPFSNLFELIENDSWFALDNGITGGVCGVLIGCSSIEKSLPLYRDLLFHHQIKADKTDHFEDLQNLPGGKGKFRRIILAKTSAPSGAFGRLLCHTEIELISSLDSSGRKIFENRYWGDLGFIHVCFDVNQMDKLKEKAESMGFDFKVDSKDNFDMGKAAGRFAYIEDPDQTLVELVETYKVPIFAPLGIFLNLKSRKKSSPLPNLFIKALGLNREK